MGGAPGAGSLLLNTKASQEAACSRAPAAIVPGQKPESRDTGVSLFAENGSHLAEADAGESYARQVKPLIHSVPRCYPPPLPSAPPRLVSSCYTRHRMPSAPPLSPPWHKRSTLQYLPGGVLGVHFLDNALKNAVLVEDECSPERPQCGLTVHFLLTPGAEGLEHLRGGVRK